MPAVVRVKRRIDEEPHSAFVLNGKKRRTDGYDAGGSTETTQAKDDISTVLKFAGTINRQDDAATKEIAARLTKDSAKQLVQQKTTSRQQQYTSATERMRKELRQAQSEQRFRVVNCQRTTLSEEESLAAATSSSSSATNIDNENNAQQLPSATTKEGSSSAVTIVDIEPAAADAAADASSSQQAAALTISADSDTGYVYDLYIPENEEEAAYVDLMDNNYLSVRLCDNLTFEDYFEEDPDEYDSEDSNQENYFTNDYPDDDEIDAFDMGYEQHLSSVMDNFRLDDDDDDVDYSNETSSSDDLDFNDGFIHIYKPKKVKDDDDDEDDDKDDHDEDDDDKDEYYGNYYERYHKRVLNEIYNDDKKAAVNHDGVDINDGGGKDEKDKSNSFPIDKQEILKEHKENNY